MELSAFEAVLALEVGADDFALACAQGLDEGDLGEGFAGGGVGGCAPAVKVFAHPGPVVGVVGGDAELAEGLEDPEGVLQEAVLDHPAFVVSGLGPGVGEVEVDGPAGVVGDAPVDKLPGVQAEHADVCQRGAAEAVGGKGEELAFVLDAEPVGVGVLGRFLQQEGALARADLQVQGAGGVGEPGLDVDVGECGVVQKVIGQAREGGDGDFDPGGVDGLAA